MKPYRELIFALLAGAVSGTLLVTGYSLNLSVRGVLEVMIAGAFVGTIGGFLLLTFRTVWPGNKLALGTIVGLLLYVCSTLLMLVGGMFAFDRSSIQLVTLGVVAAVFVVYGVWAAALLIRFNRY